MGRDLQYIQLINMTALNACLLEQYYNKTTARHFLHFKMASCNNMLLGPSPPLQKSQTSPPWGPDSQSNSRDSKDSKGDQMPHICPGSPSLGLTLMGP